MPRRYQKIEFKTSKTARWTFPGVPNGYVAMVQHYFASAWLLADGVQRNCSPARWRQPVLGRHDHATGQHRPRHHQGHGCPPVRGPPGRDHDGKAVPGLELVKDYGWLTILSKPLYWLLDQLHKLLGNWGWSIVALVLLLKIAFYWLNAKAYASMAKMKAINPKIMECASA